MKLGRGQSRLRTWKRTHSASRTRARRRDRDAYAPFHEGRSGQALFQLFRLSYADDGDECRSIRHSQSLAAPAGPQGNDRPGGLEAMPNACNNCHMRPGEDPAWAATDDRLCKELAPPVAGGFFGPRADTYFAAPADTDGGSGPGADRFWDEMEIREWIAGHSSPWPDSSASWFSRAFYKLRARGNHMLNWLSRFGAWIDRTARRSWAGITRFFWPDPDSPSAPTVTVCDDLARWRCRS